MSPTACAALFLVGLALDYMGIGPANIRDRFAFVFYLAAFNTAFNGSAADKYTVEFLTGLIQYGLDGANSTGAYIGAASANLLFSVVVSLAFVMAVGIVLPVKKVEKLGHWVKRDFRRKRGSSPKGGASGSSIENRINYGMMALAFVLGVTHEIPQGALGTMMSATVTYLTEACGIVPLFLFEIK